MREYKRQIVVIGCHQNGQDTMFSLRYGALTVHGLKFLITAKGKAQILWPKFPIKRQGRIEWRQAVTPIRGITRHIIKAVQDYMAQQQAKAARIEPEPPKKEQSEPQKKNAVSRGQILCPECRKATLKRLTGDEDGYQWECPGCLMRQFTFNLLKFDRDCIPPEMISKLEQSA
jgi:hypothetical protein